VSSEFSPPREPETTAAPGSHAATVSVSSRAHVYDLRRGNTCSDAFYAVLPAFADQTITAIERRAAPLLDGYSRHVQTFLGEEPRSRGEYALELLTLGMTVSRYETTARKTHAWIISIARWLNLARERFPRATPLIDWARAGLARYSLALDIGRKPKKRAEAVERLVRITEWLQSTGEFRHEARRLNNWRSYFANLSAPKATDWLRAAVELFQEFERQAERALGAYTRGVAPYLAREHEHLRWREDLLTCGKPSVEYHLNMVAAEVMNRGLREDYAHTSQRILLVPACMRRWQSRDCKAHIDGVDMTCAACDPDCAVNRLTLTMREHGIPVYIVPHSSGFSRWLERWQHTGAGVTAVACVLNILPGGLEMRDRGIAAQCLPLDFPGCRKHWDRLGFPTAVNEKRLVQIATADARPS
jgi:hypothetical protein